MQRGKTGCPEKIGLGGKERRRRRGEIGGGGDHGEEDKVKDCIRTQCHLRMHSD